MKLDGDIGILGNGAGLVMSTLDVVAQAGGRPANFCDIGGGAQADVVVGALEVITADPVKAILFNIFGGITRGGEVAKGLLEALERMDIEVPVVVRIDGTEADEGRRLLAERCAGERPRRAHDARCGAARRRARGVAMAIIVDTDTRLVVQGITGREGTFHTLRNRDYGTNVVAGVTPGKGGESVDGIPVFDTVRDAVAETEREHGDGLRARALRGRRRLRGGRRGHRDRDRDHRGHPGARHAPHLQLHPPARRDDGGAELPGRALAGQGERRHHPGRDLLAGPGRAREPFRHAHVSDRATS